MNNASRFFIIQCSAPVSGKYKTRIQFCHLSRIDVFYTYPHTFINALKACQRIEDGRELHSEICKKGFTSNMCISHILISLYAKCGTILDAESVFTLQTCYNVVSWNVMLASYARLGHGTEALQLYRQMLEQGMHPNERTFVSILRVCCNHGENVFYKTMLYEIGQALHADVLKKGFASDIYILCTLVHMYGECGYALEAENVFTNAVAHSVVYWNTTMSMYIKHGKPKMALHLYKRMHYEWVKPDERTFVIAIQGCSFNKYILGEGLCKDLCLEIGRALHMDARRQGFTSDVFVGTTLVSMYGKCGSVQEAEIAFKDVLNPNISSWNALLSAYADQGEIEKAFQLYRQMEEENLYLDEQTFTVALKACYLACDDEDGHIYLEIGRALHSKGRRKGFCSDVLSSTLILMYAKFGHICEAENVYITLEGNNVISSNALISAYIQVNETEKALQFYSLMQSEGIHADCQTYVNVIQACNCLAGKEEYIIKQDQQPLPLMLGQAFHAHARSEGLTSNSFISCSLITMYSKCGRFSEAEAVLSVSFLDTTVPWNAMLNVYLEQGQETKVLQLYRRMQMTGVTPDDVTYLCMLEASGKVGDVDACWDINWAVSYHVFGCTSTLSNALISAYGNCSRVEDAKATLYGLAGPDILSWSALIAGYAQLGDSLASHVSLKEMECEGTVPDGTTFLSLLSACNHDGVLDRGFYYYELMNKDYGIIPDSKHLVTMIDVLGRSGNLARLQKSLWDFIAKEPHVATFKSLLGSCHSHGNMDIAKAIYNRAVHINPNKPSAYVLMSNISGDPVL